MHPAPLYHRSLVCLSDTSEARLRYLLIEARPDIFTVLFNFAKHRDAWAFSADDADSPRVRREVIRVICRIVALCKGASGSGEDG